ACALSNTCEDRHSPMQLGNIMNELHDHDRLADSGAAERAYLAALEEGANQVDDFDTSWKNLRRCGLFDQRWRKPVDRIIFLRLNRPALVYRISRNIKHPAHDTVPDGHAYWTTAIRNVEAAFETLRPGHGDCPDQLVSKMLLYFKCQIHGLILNLIFDGKGVIDPGQCFREFHIYDRTADLDNFASAHVKTSFTLDVINVRSASLTTGDLQQLLRDGALAQLVIFERQVFDQSVGIIRGVFHRYHASALLTRP